MPSWPWCEGSTVFHDHCKIFVRCTQSLDKYSNVFAYVSLVFCVCAYVCVCVGNAISNTFSVLSCEFCQQARVCSRVRTPVHFEGVALQQHDNKNITKPIEWQHNLNALNENTKFDMCMVFDDCREREFITVECLNFRKPLLIPSNSTK